LISLDTTRVDRLGCYGYSRRTSPNLDRLAAEAVVYTRAIATSSWTLPAHASMFTGKLTSSHGAEYDPEGPLGLASVIEAPRDWKRYRARPLVESERTLAEMLREAGYATGAVVGGPWMKRPFGLAQGFDFYDDDQIGTSDGRPADLVTAAAVRWLERTPGKELFLFLNYFDPHGPYTSPEPFARAFLPPGAKLSQGVPEGEELQARYDAEVLYMDHHVGALLDHLRRQGLYERALIVVAADHGELLGEHGRLGHGDTLTQPEIHIPFLVKHPGRAVPTARSDAPVQLTDVLPIVLKAAGLGVPTGIQGGLPPDRGHPVVAEVAPIAGPAWRALFDGSLKLLWNSRGGHQLFDVAADPAESVDLAAREPERVRTLASLLERYLASLPRPGHAGPVQPLDEATRRALKSLGYVR
jgi:arylsulfatase A-like enzyme